MRSTHPTDLRLTDGSRSRHKCARSRRTSSRNRRFGHPTDLEQSAGTARQRERRAASCRLCGATRRDTSRRQRSTSSSASRSNRRPRGAYTGDRFQCLHRPPLGAGLCQASAFWRTHSGERPSCGGDCIASGLSGAGGAFRRSALPACGGSCRGTVVGLAHATASADDSVRAAILSAQQDDRVCTELSSVAASAQGPDASGDQLPGKVFRDPPTKAGPASRTSRCGECEGGDDVSVRNPRGGAPIEPPRGEQIAIKCTRPCRGLPWR